jgi:hypothetical protein
MRHSKDEQISIHDVGAEDERKSDLQGESDIEKRGFTDFIVLENCPANDSKAMNVFIPKCVLEQVFRSGQALESRIQQQLTLRSFNRSKDGREEATMNAWLCSHVQLVVFTLSPE